MKKQKQKTLGLSVALSVMTLAAPTASADPQPNTFKAIWSDTSEILNQSTKALNEGEISRALRIAKDALDGDLTYGDKVIAAHNLCIGYLELSSTAAEEYCRTAITVPSRMVVKPVNGELKIRSGRTNFVPSMGAQTLSSVVGWNIHQVYTRATSQTAHALPTR